MPSAQQKKRAEKKKQQERERMAKKNNKKESDEPENEVEKVAFFSIKVVTDTSLLDNLERSI